MRFIMRVRMCVSAYSKRLRMKDDSGQKRESLSDWFETTTGRPEGSAPRLSEATAQSHGSRQAQRQGSKPICKTNAHNHGFLCVQTNSFYTGSKIVKAWFPARPNARG